MPILRDTPISLTPEQVVEAQTRGQSQRTRNRSAMMADARRAIELAQTLYAPAAVYTELQVQEVKEEHVTLMSSNSQVEEHVLKVGPHADLLAPATRVLVAACTIGPALEERVNQLNASGEVVAAYWLDSVGVMALGEVGEKLRRIAEEQAVERGWGVGAAIGPGSLVGWSVQGQRKLCALLPLSAIGMRLNAHYILEPHKSVSMAIGIGPGYKSQRVGSVCRFCSLADTCWRRR